MMLFILILSSLSDFGKRRRISVRSECRTKPPQDKTRSDNPPPEQNPLTFLHG